MVNKLPVKKCECGGTFIYDSKTDLVECNKCGHGMSYYAYQFYIRGLPMSPEPAQDNKQDWDNNV